MYQIAQSPLGPTWSNSGSMMGSAVRGAGFACPSHRRERDRRPDDPRGTHRVEAASHTMSNGSARLSDGLERLTTDQMSAVLLDLQLSDCPGLDALEKLVRAAPATPILVVGTDESHEFATTGHPGWRARLSAHESISTATGCRVRSITPLNGHCRRKCFCGGGATSRSRSIPGTTPWSARISRAVSPISTGWRRR